jgi:hypothetical protein
LYIPLYAGILAQVYQMMGNYYVLGGNIFILMYIGALPIFSSYVGKRVDSAAFGSKTSQRYRPLINLFLVHCTHRDFFFFFFYCFRVGYKRDL